MQVKTHVCAQIISFPATGLDGPGVTTVAMCDVNSKFLAGHVLDARGGEFRVGGEPGPESCTIDGTSWSDSGEDGPPVFDHLSPQRRSPAKGMYVRQERHRASEALWKMEV